MQLVWPQRIIEHDVVGIGIWKAVVVPTDYNWQLPKVSQVLEKSVYLLAADFIKLDLGLKVSDYH